MRVRYPKSFLGLLFVGLALVALPLIFALVYNAVAIDQLTNQGQRSVYDATRLIQSSRALSESITGLERIARQYVVLRDDALLDAYRDLRTTLLSSVRQLEALQLDEPQRTRLAEVVDREAGVWRDLPTLRGAGKDAEAKAGEVVAQFEQLAQAVERLSLYSNSAIEREAETLRVMSQKAYENMVLQMLALVPVAIFLLVGFPLLIVPPIRQVARGIRDLGDGKFDKPIAVDGPQDLQNLGQQLDWLRLRLIDLEEQQRKFLGHVSHELKTPLTALREGSDLLADEVVGPLNAEQREIARILRDNSLQLRRLIEGLLNYSAAEFQRGRLNVKQVKMSDVVRAVAEDHRLALRTRGVSLKLDCEPVFVAGDEEKLRTVVDNLLSNALKFTPKGGRIELALHREDDRAVIDVVDSGPGIGPEERDRIFRPFMQGRALQSGPVKGTGLGLSIVHEYVTAHGGTVEVVDRPPPGAQFRVTLPLHRWQGA
ncbi:MAG TPA: ATP-binding protein [Pelomicrobium sp.]|nr:ATP-binding protein [Pelomicrobium sp.]